MGDGIKVVRIPSYPSESNGDDSGVSETPSMTASISEGDKLAEPAFYFHTSGTSTGLPSPIPQSHAIVAALPCFESKNQTATFSTTPLYHGGLADCLRAWTSGAMMWCFPEGQFPLTARNVVRAVEFARTANLAPVNFFSSVPYVLQMLIEDADGLPMLSSMDLVGVGGAAMPVAVGNQLVQSGVNLLSRFGSAECGFLLSSHREYSSDKEWEYLRVQVAPEFLRFEPRDGGLSELVVQPSWPFRSKTNREDGSYVTSDLFEPHPNRENLWRYHSRADSQITLANGKKFDPSPLEQGLQASTPLLRDAYVFGTGKPCAGVLLFPDSDAPSGEVIAAVKQALSHFNPRSSPHARIEESMLIIVPSSTRERALPKSSKGSIMRHQADAMYASLIEAAYTVSPASNNTEPVRLQIDELKSTILDSIQRVLHRSVDPDRDLYQQGVDSIACIQIRKSIETKRLVPSDYRIPLNIVYDQGTVKDLASHIHDVWEPSERETPREDSQLACMESLVKKYRMQSASTAQTKIHSGSSAIVLTGATGFLGSYILGLLRQRPIATRIYCLVRAQTHDEATKRVCQSQTDRGFPSLPSEGEKRGQDPLIVCLPFEAGPPHLNLHDNTWQTIVREAKLVIHAAWPVNFNLPLSSYVNQFACLTELLALAEEAEAHLIFISSMAAAIVTDQPSIPEKITDDASSAAPLGYARSKWVAEKICADSNLTSARGSRGGLASVIRIGQLCGDSSTGAWNRSEAYPLMFSAANSIGALPDLHGEGTNWLPVDVAARSILEISIPGFADRCRDLHDLTWAGPSADNSRSSTTPVYHVANPFDCTPWRQVVDWISTTVSAIDPSRQMEVLPAVDWVDRVDRQLAENHPARGLVGFWKQTFSQNAELSLGLGRSVIKKPAQIEIDRARQLAESIGAVAPLDQQTVERLWLWTQM